MAKVISWQISSENSVAYLGINKSSNYTDVQILPNGQKPNNLNDIASYWYNKELSDYQDAFNALKYAIESRFGYSNLKSASVYFDVLNKDASVYVVTGKDGKNTYDPGTPYYTLHVINQNIALGLGDDYILDRQVMAVVHLYAERDGVIKTSDITSIKVSDITNGSDDIDYGYQRDSNTNNYDIRISIASGTPFDTAMHSRTYRINVTFQNGYSGDTYFSITGVKDGAEGSFYNLTLSAKTIKKDKDGNYSHQSVSAYCVKNGDVIESSQEFQFEIKYFKSGTEYTYSEAIPATSVEESAQSTIHFQLMHNGHAIDTAECSVIMDGTDASPVCKLELNNEMDGISFGDTNILQTDVTTGSNMKMWYKGKNVELTKVEFKLGDEIVSGQYRNVKMRLRYAGHESTVYTDFSSNNTWVQDSIDANSVDFDIKFLTGFEINEGYRQSITITATATTEDGPFVGTAAYVLIGMKGGKNGQVFRLQTNVDYIFYDPNTKHGSVDVVSCTAYTGTEEIQTGEDEEYVIGISYDDVYSSWEDVVSHIPERKYVDNVNETAVTDGISSITFYLFYKSDDGVSRFLVDRETIPVILQGLNAHERVVLELENEVTGVALGGDGDLDTAMSVGTPFKLYSGSTTIPFYKVEITAPSEFNRNEENAHLTINGDTYDAKIVGGSAVFDIDVVTGNSGEAEFAIDLFSGIRFDTSNFRKKITISVSYSDVEIEGVESLKTCKSVYTILGIDAGEDGVVYRLQPSVSSIVKDENKTGTSRYNPSELTCDAYEGIERITDVSTSHRSYKITYNIDTDVPENSTDTLGYSIPVDDRIVSRVYYYLYYRPDTSRTDNWLLVDKESIPIVCDGKDGKDGKDASERTELELANEIEGIGIGNNKTLDIPLTVGTDFYVFSGTTKIGFKKIEVQTSVDYGFLTGSTGTILRLYKDGSYQAQDDFNENGLATITTNIDGYEKARIEIDLKPVLGFDESTQKRIFHISATTLDNIVYSADFTVIGLINGKDGDVFKVVPSEDVVMYDPNSKEYSVTGITCQAYNGGTELTGDEYEIRYSYNNDVDYDRSSAYTANDDICVTGNGVSRVYLYLYYVTGSTTPVLLDRETVPIIYDGLNGGTPVYLEFGNEIEAIGVDEDGVLNSNVTASTDFYVLSGATKIAFNKLVITTPERGIVTGTTGCQCKIELSGYTGTTGFTVIDDKATATFTDISATSYDEQLLSIGIVPDLYFNEKQQRVFTVTATYKDNDNQEQTTKSNFVILGLKNGEDGSIFRVKPNVNTIVFDSNKTGDERYSPSAITCEAYNGVVKITSLADSLEDGTGYTITYSIDSEQSTAENTTIYTGGTIVVTGVANRLYLYLWYRENVSDNWTLFDKESVPIVKDGIDGKGANDVVLFEVFNEIDAIGVGSNLTVDTALTASTSFCLYSGATPLVFNRLKIQANKDKFRGAKIELVYEMYDYWSSSFNTSGVADINLVGSPTGTLPEGYKKLDLYIELPTGLTFEDGQKEVFYLSAYTSSYVYYTARFSVLGLANGEDGEVFKLTPTVNSIVKDPNNNGICDPTGITCGAFNGVTDLTPYAGMPTDSTAVTDSGYVGYRVKCSINDPIDDPSATGSSLYTGKIVESSDIISRIYFYLVWREKTGDTWTLLDKESVPIIKSGLDGRGSADKFTMDLTNKTDSWGVGDNGILDITISASTGIETYSGGTLTGVSQVKVEIDDVYFEDTQKWLSGCTDHCAVKVGGTAKTANFVIVGNKLQAVFSGTTLPTNDGKLDLYIILNSGISFNNSQKLEFKVTATSSDGSKNADAIFSVVGLKYGKDGETFSLKLSTNNIVFDSNKDKSDYNAYSPRTLTCKAYLNKTKLATEDTDKTTGYTILSSETEITETTISDITGRYNGTPISANTVTGNTIYFYLFYRENTGDTWEYLDDESASIIPGGKNANERIFAELSNEIEGVGTEGDYILGKETVVSTKAYLYSGTSKLNISKIDVKVDSGMTGITYSAITGTTVINSGTITAQTTTITGLSGKDLELKFGLFGGLEFPEKTYKRTIEIGLYTGNTAYTADFSILAIKEGAEGSIYRLITSLNTIVYDPNQLKYEDEEIECAAYSGGVSLSANTSGSNFIIYYTLDDICDKKPEEEGSTLSALTSALTLTFADLGTFKKIYFYLYYHLEDDFYLFDRECVPVVNDGLNAVDSRVYLELGNEMSPVSVGDDSILDTTERVPVDIDFMLFSGSTEIGFSGITVQCDEGFTGFTCELYTGATSEFPLTATTINETGAATFSNVIERGKEPRIVIYLENGFDFGVFSKKKIKISVTTTVDGEPKSFSATHTIVGVKNGKDGEEGLVYRLLPSTSSIIRTDNGNASYSPSYISCDAVTKYGTLSGETDDHNNYLFTITYAVDSAITKTYSGTTYERPTVGSDYDRWNSGLTLTELIQNGEDHVYFGLWFNFEGTNNLIDREGIPILTQPSDRIYLECGNEIEAVGTGGDENEYQLDHDTHVNTDITLFSGATKIDFTSGITLESVGCELSGCTCKITFGNSASAQTTFIEEGGVCKATFNYSEIFNGSTAKIDILLKAGTVFDSGTSKIYVTISTKYNNVTYPCTFIICGLKNGIDGAVYRLAPQYDSVVYDQNGSKYIPSGMTCSAIGNGRTIDEDEIVHTSGETGFQILYSYNEIQPYVGLIDMPLSGISFDNSLVYERIYFYLYYNWKNDGGEWVREIFDRESIPVLLNGLNSVDRMFAELDNEIDGVCVGTDNILNKDIPVWTRVHLYSGASETKIDKIVVNTSSTGLTGATCNVYFGENEATSATTEFDVQGNALFSGNTISSNTGAIKIEVIFPSGYTFNEDTQKEPFIIKSYKTVEVGDEREFACVYSVIGFRDGEDGAIYRLLPSVNEIVFNPNDETFSPSAITCEGTLDYKPITDDNIELRYSIDTLCDYDDTDELPKTGITLDDTGITRVYFYMYNVILPLPILLDRESIPVIHSGEKGEEGTPGTPGTPGEDSITYWLSPSTTSIVVNKDETGYTVSCEAYKQVGSNEPIPSSDFTGITGEPKIYYYFDKVKTTESGYTGGTQITFSKSDIKVETRLTFVLKTGTTVYDTRTIDILVDKAKILRRSVWETGKTYYDGETDDGDGNYYYDVVTNKGVAYAEDATLNYWVCISSHTSTTENCPWEPEGESEWHGDYYWTGLTAQEPMTTPLIIASAISSDYLDVNNLYVYDNNTANKKVILYAGNQNIPLICGSDVNTGATSSTIEDTSGITSWITATGEIHSKNLVANGGSIGGWEITNGSITSNGDSITLNSVDSLITLKSNSEHFDYTTDIEGKFYNLSDLSGGTTQNIGSGSVGRLSKNVTFSSKTQTSFAINFDTLSSKTFTVSANDSQVSIKALNVSTLFATQRISVDEDHSDDFEHFSGYYHAKFYLSGTTSYNVLTKEITQYWNNVNEFISFYKNNYFYNNENKTITIDSGTYRLVLESDIHITYRLKENATSFGDEVFNNYNFTFNSNISVGKNELYYNHFFGNGMSISSDYRNNFISMLREENDGTDEHPEWIKFAYINFISNNRSGFEIYREKFNIRIKGNTTTLNAGTLPSNIRIGHSVKTINYNEMTITGNSYSYSIYLSDFYTYKYLLSTFTGATDTSYTVFNLPSTNNLPSGSCIYVTSDGGVRFKLPDGNVCGYFNNMAFSDSAGYGGHKGKWGYGAEGAHQDSLLYFTISPNTIIKVEYIGGHTKAGNGYAYPAYYISIM